MRQPQLSLEREFNAARMLVQVNVGNVHVVMKTGVGETKLLGNAIITISFCSNVKLELSRSSLFKRDSRNGNSSVERNARSSRRGVLHVVMKTRVGETKLLLNGILTISSCLNEKLEVFYKSVFKTDHIRGTSSVFQMIVGVIMAVLHVVL